MNPDAYRGPFGNDGAAYAADMADHIKHATTGHVAGFFHETIQGVGGTVPLADGYLSEVYKVGTRYAPAHTAGYQLAHMTLSCTLTKATTWKVLSAIGGWYADLTGCGRACTKSSR